MDNCLERTVNPQSNHTLTHTRPCLVPTRFYPTLTSLATLSPSLPPARSFRSTTFHLPSLTRSFTPFHFVPLRSSHKFPSTIRSLPSLMLAWGFLSDWKVGWELGPLTRSLHSLPGAGRVNPRPLGSSPWPHKGHPYPAHSSFARSRSRVFLARSFHSLPTHPSLTLANFPPPPCPH